MRNMKIKPCEAFSAFVYKNNNVCVNKIMVLWPDRCFLINKEKLFPLIKYYTLNVCSRGK